jgi:hypothetical protein
MLTKSMQVSQALIHKKSKGPTKTRFVGLFFDFRSNRQLALNGAPVLG